MVGGCASLCFGICEKKEGRREPLVRPLVFVWRRRDVPGSICCRGTGTPRRTLHTFGPRFVFGSFGDALLSLPVSAVVPDVNRKVRPDAPYMMCP